MWAIKFYGGCMNSRKLLWVIFICAFICANTIQAQSQSGSIFPNQGVIGQDLEVAIKGSGFNAGTRVVMYPDTGKKGILGSASAPDNIRGITIEGDLAYVAAGDSGLRIIDVSDPSTPITIGTLDTPGRAWGVAVAGNTAYVADYDEGLQVIDVSNPEEPVIVGAVYAGNQPQGVAVQGSTAFVAAGNSGLRVVDVSDPEEPKHLGSVSTPGFARAVTVAGNKAYIADGSGGLQVIDISTPASPYIVGSLSAISNAGDVAVQDDKAFVAAETAGLVVIDVSEPASPVIISTIATPGAARGVAVEGTRVYVADASSGLLVVDAGASTPTIIGAVLTSGAAETVAVKGFTAYVASDKNMRVVDVGKPVLPFLGFAKTPGSASGIALAGDMAYVADNTGLQVIEVSDPASPFIAGAAGSPGYPMSVVVEDDIAYLAAGSGGLRIIDVSDPSTPITIGTQDTPGSAWGVAVAGNTAYVADYNQGLQVIDVSIPGKAEIVGSKSTSGSAQAVYVADDLAYVITSGSKYQSAQWQLLIFNISDTLELSHIGSAKISLGARSVTVKDNRAYIAVGNYLKIFDVSLPSSPYQTGSVDIFDEAHDVVVQGATAYVAAGNSGLHVIDVSNPTAPVIIYSVDTPGTARGGAVQDDIAYVATSLGLTIVPVPHEIKAVNLVNSSTLNVTLPAPSKPGNYNLRVFTSGSWTDLPEGVNFSALDFSMLEPSLLEVRTEQGEVPDKTLETGQNEALQLIYKTPDGTPINLSTLTQEVTVQWLSSNPEVLSVSPAGMVVAMGPGQATISAKVSGGGKNFTFQVEDPEIDEPAGEFGNLIVVAGRNSEQEELAKTFQALASMAYETFYKRGLSHDDIYYISAYEQQTLPGESQEIVDDVLGLSDDGKTYVIDTVTGWAAGQNNTGPLFIYLVDHGVNQQLKITPNSVLSAALLDEALTGFQNDTGRDVVVMVEACYSGTWKDPLAKEGRLILTSTGNKWQNLPTLNTSNTFSGFLFRGFSKGQTIEKAYEFAVEGVNSNMLGKSSDQSPLYAAGDIELWESHVAGPWASAASFSIFSDYIGMDEDALQLETGDKLDLGATLDIINQAWVEVYALLTPPAPGDQTVGEFETPVLEQVLVPLNFETETGDKDYFGQGLKVFTGASSPIPTPGEWELAYYVKDQNNELTASYPVTLNVTGEPLFQKYDLNLTSGWNLLGLPIAPVSNNVDVLFSDIENNIESAWKWNAGNWTVYLPGLEDGGAAYASSKNFGQLTEIGCGEGFWVNAGTDQSLNVTGTQSVDTTCSLTTGWNLIGLKSNETKSIADFISGNKGYIASVWKWDNGKWAVYLPGEDDGGAAYAESKGFNVLENINPGEGFWVNAIQQITLD
jgi:hypothetical protein